MARLEIIVDSGNAQNTVKTMNNLLTALEQSGVKVDASMNQASQSIDKFGKASAQTAIAQQKLALEVSKTETSLNSLGATAIRVSAAVGIAFGVSEIVKTVDAYTGLQNKLRLVTSNQYELAAATKSVFDISNSTRTSVESNVLVYQRFTENATRLALSQTQVASISKTVAQAVAISGSSTESANSAIMQFSQSLASGVFRGEEFNSVNEQAHGIITALQIGLGKTQGELRAMANAGQLTSSVIVEGMQKSKEAIDKLFQTSVPTLSQAFVVLKNESSQFLGEQTSGAAAALSKTIIGLADNFDLVANSVAVLVAGGLAGYLTKGAIAAATAAHEAAGLYAANLLAAQGANAVAVSEARAAATVLAAAKAEQVLAAEGAALTGINARLAMATEAVTVATTASTAADIRATEAKAALTIASRGVLGVIGGPVGLAVIAASVAAAFLLSGQSANAATPKIDIIGNSYDEVRKKLEGLTQAEREHELQANKAKVATGAQSLGQSREDIGRSITSAETRGGFSTDTRIEINKLSDAFQKGTIDGDKFQSQLAKIKGLPDGFLETTTAGIANYNSLVKVQKEQIAATQLEAKANAERTAQEAGLNEEQKQALRNKLALIEQEKTGNAILIKQRNDMKRQLEDTLDPTFAGKAARDIRDQEKSIELGGQGLKFSQAQKYANIATARAQDEAAESLKRANKLKEDQNKIDAETENRNQSIKQSYLQLADTYNDPIQKAANTYIKNLALIDRAEEGLAAKRNTNVSTPLVNFKLNDPNSKLKLNFNNVPIADARKLIAESGYSPEDQAYALNQVNLYYAKLTALTQDKQAQALKIEEDSANAKRAIEAVRYQQAKDLNELAQDQQLASLSDFQLTERQKIEQQADFKLRQVRDQDSTTIDQMIKQAELEVAVMEKKAHDLADIENKRAIDSFNIQNAVTLKGNDVRFGQRNAVVGALGGSTQAAQQQEVFNIEKKLAADSLALQQGLARDATQAQKDEVEAKIKNLEDASAREIALAKETSAAVLDTRAALLSAGAAIEDGIASSLTKAIIQGDSLRDSLRNVAISGAEMLLQSMIKIGLQHGINALLEVGATEAVTAAKVTATAVETGAALGAVAVTTPAIVGSQTAIAAAAAPAAAGVSISTLGTAAIVALGAVAAVYGLTKGFKTGGYTGDVGTDEVAGVVHGQEYVMTADKTAKYRPILDSMKNGTFEANHLADTAPPRMQSSNQTPQGQNPTIHIHNHGIDEAIEDWFKGSSSDKHVVNKISRNRSSISQVIG